MVARCLIRTSSLAARCARFSTCVAARGPVSLPDLDFDFGALEPHVSGVINELHYTKHHQTYVNGYNIAIEKLATAQTNGDVRAQIELAPLINFHGGGHVNHSLFWKNLAPVSAGGGEPPAPQTGLAQAIQKYFGGLDKLIAVTNAKLAGIQGSGWAWIVKNTENGALQVITLPNQDPVLSPFVPLVGIDAWEHAYYLQYRNVKADYFKAIWNVVNWSEASRRWDLSGGV